VVCLLCVQGCTLNVTDHCGDPPLILAAGGGEVELSNNQTADGLGLHVWLSAAFRYKCWV
jgi:hypothetical protein